MVRSSFVVKILASPWRGGGRQLLHLLGSSTSAAVVADVAGLLSGAGGATRIDVLSLAAFVATSVLTDLVLRSVLLLAGDGLLVVVCRIRLACSVFRALAEQLPARVFFWFSGFIGDHMIPPVLNLTAIPAYLLRSVVHTFRNILRIRLIRVRKRMLILGGRLLIPCWGLLASARPNHG